MMSEQAANRELAYSTACERNKKPILEKLKLEMADVGKVWEIGSGTGQHAVFFSQELPHLIWQPCDLKNNHPDIRARVKDSVRSCM